MPDWTLPAAIVGFLCGSIGFLVGGAMGLSKALDEDIVERAREERQAEIEKTLRN